MINNERLYLIALTFVKGVGDVLARHLLQYFGQAEAIFREKKNVLEKVPGIGEYTAAGIVATKGEALQRAERELAFVEKNRIRLYTITEEDYPVRLRECPDAPIVFYYRGNADLNVKRILSVVGTRRVTDYGKNLTASLLKDLSEIFPDLLIISGLAYGVDVQAHRQALKNGLPTVGVLAHGLDRIYPATHRNVAVEMVKDGGLMTDFPSETTPDRENFLKRNRLIAGLADATVVVESAEKGGALNTADIAFSYSRDVYTFPGRVDDEHSKGCNRLIQSNKAGLITSAGDLIVALGWETSEHAESPRQEKLTFHNPLPNHPVIAALAGNGSMQINDLALAMNTPVYQLSSMLFELEMAGHVKAMPGGVYKINR